MPVKNDREYRSALEFRAVERNDEQEKYIVEGYASTFEKYVLFEYEGEKYYEQIDRSAFDECDMSDVIMQFDHMGMVYARTSNGTLEVNIDDHGLKMKADLSSTNATRELYEQIRTGLITKMSFAFTVDEDEYDKKEMTRTITKIKKLYDVSAVSLPANPTTNIGIEPRSLFNGVIEELKAERLEEARKEKARKILALRLRLED